MPSLCNSLHASTLEFGDSAPISAVSALPRSLLGPRMRNSEGVPKDGGKHPNFSAETENDPGPAGAPGRAPDSGMVCCDARREGRRSGPVPGFAHARKCGPRTGDDPRDPHRPGALTACHRCCGTHARSGAQRDQWATGPRKGTSVPHGRSCSGTIKCGHTNKKRLKNKYRWLYTWARVPLAARNCTSLAKIRLSNNRAEHRYGSAKRKYGVGGMEEVWNRKYERSGGRFDHVDLCARGARGAHGAPGENRGVVVRPRTSALRENFWTSGRSGGAPVKT